MEVELFLRIVLGQIPMFVACSMACIMIVVRMPGLGKAGTLGLLGFGGKLVLGFLQPITFILIQKQVAQSVGVVQSAAFMTLVNIFFSILQAVIVIMLLTALLIGRPNPNHTSS
ncbi:MAG: hypothetical protein U0905_03240 [Pirellulales bacterium]